jgi:hypothetical protein
MPNVKKIVKYQAGGVAKPAKRVGPIDPKGAWTKVQERTLADKKAPKVPLTKDKQLGATTMKKGGKVKKNWIGDVAASIKRRGTEGKCTPISKPGCTGKAKALAKTFKKIAAKRKAK